MTAEEGGSCKGFAGWVLAILEDCSFCYAFDDLGRTVEVDMDPTADSAVYRFTYG